jgi:geranylgeranyl diphosphate synthase, type II
MLDLVSFKSTFGAHRALVESLLERYLPSVNAEPRKLHEAMRYSVLAGGKRLRPILALATYEHCGGKISGDDLPIHRAMAGLEMVHTYSLIHDDLPCMDDDDLRRGIPTCHKKFGEATAVLAGDALHVVAFQLMAQTGMVQAVEELAEAVGTSGMIGGQVADVEAEGKNITEREIVYIHQRKTGALIRCSVRIGALLAGANGAEFTRLSHFGEMIGLAFQIIDDILDVEGDPTLLGKNAGSDSKKQKATYPRVVGMEQARTDANRLIDEAISLVDDGSGNLLTWLARFIGQRES